MDASELSSAVAHAGDPVLVVDGDGLLLAANERAALFFDSRLAGPCNLESLLPAPLAAEILKTQQYSAFEAEVESGLGKVRQTVIAADISSGSPADVRLLLIFKSAPSESRSADERQEFLASIAHDLKNPLGAIFGYADALLDTPAGEGLTAKQRDVVARMRNTASRSIDLVRNYQHLSALRSSSISLSGSPIDMNVVTKSVVDYTYREDSNVASLGLDLSKVPLPVRVDRIQLERIISNLLTNAIKYTPRDERISIRTWSEGSTAYLRINNTAPVINKAELPLLFERYGRTSTSVGRSGSGLGLYIVKFLLDALKGSIKVTSREGEGTTFTASLPLAD